MSFRDAAPSTTEVLVRHLRGHTYTINAGQRFTSRYRGTVEVVPRPTMGFESIYEHAIFLKFLDEDGQPIESRSEDAFLATYSIGSEWNPDLHRTCSKCRGTGTRWDQHRMVSMCMLCCHGVPRLYLDRVHLRVI